jgi:hypothetical protein
MPKNPTPGQIAYEAYLMRVCPFALTGKVP